RGDFHRRRRGLEVRGRRERRSVLTMAVRAVARFRWPGKVGRSALAMVHREVVAAAGGGGWNRRKGQGADGDEAAQNLGCTVRIPHYVRSWDRRSGERSADSLPFYEVVRQKVLNQTNWFRKRTSFSKKKRMSGTPKRRMAMRSTPSPKANPEYF